MKKSVLLVLLLLSLFPTARSFAQDNNKIVQSYYFGFGPGYFSNLNSRSMATVFSAGMVWNVDVQFDLSVNADLGISFEHNDVRFFNPALEGRYIFSEESNHSWYAGGGLGLGYGANHEDATHGSESSTGFSISAAVGFKAYRKTAMPILIELEHQMVMKESVYGTPILTWLKFAVYFP